MSNKLSIVILAAGQGKRMQSDLPKVLHPLAGKPLLTYVLETAAALLPDELYIVHGNGGGQVQQAYKDRDITWVEQHERLGTGHAVSQALPHLGNNGQVLVLYGDVPLISRTTLQMFLEDTPKNSVGVITAVMPDPACLGRIVRNEQGNMVAIVENKDATAEQKQINEINSGIILAPAAKLQQWLPELKPHNAQSELYLTDIIEMAVGEGMTISTTQPMDYKEVLGVNDPQQLAELESCL